MTHKIISRGIASGEYQAFPDSCRLDNGDMVAVFYAGYGHVSYPNEAYPKGGRICLTRSTDEGRTWSEPVAIYDDEFDNRDPHIAQLSNGMVVCSFFSLKRSSTNPQGYECLNAQIIRSFDQGATWEHKSQFVLTDTPVWVCSAPVHEMPDGTYILPIYREDSTGAWGGVVHSHDLGETWGEAIPIGQDSGLVLPAETDITLLKDGSLYAALRGDENENMQYATSSDGGLSWSPVQDIGFQAHAPHFNRLSSGEVLMTCRARGTGLLVSRDECHSWLGPYTIDLVGGAYPSTIELNDGSILAIYYEEGPGSAVRARRFSLPTDIQFLPLE
jgi:sialidase-1